MAVHVTAIDAFLVQPQRRGCPGLGLRVAALCGSLRKASYNRMALRAAIRLAPEGMAIEEADLLAALAAWTRRLRGG
jgi:hypothetical protein